MRYKQKTLAELEVLLNDHRKIGNIGKKYDKVKGKAIGKAIGLCSQPTKNKAKLKTAKMFPHVKHAIAPHKLGWY